MNLGELRTKTRYYLDDDSATRYTNTEVNVYINLAYNFYYQELVSHGYDGLLTTPASLNIVASTDTIALPSTFLKVKTLLRVIDTRKIPLEYFRNYDNVEYSNKYGEYVPTYDLQGLNIKLYPTPDSSYTAGLELRYWPIMTELVDDANSPVAGFIAPWQNMITLKAAIFAKGGREEEDVSTLSSLLALIEEPYRNTLQSMTISRQTVESFSTGD